MADNKLRLLICTGCGAVEELPDYEGPWKNDTWFNEKVKGHLLPSGEKTHGDVHIGRIEMSKWLSHRDDIVAHAAEEFKMPGEGVGLGNTFYDTKSNFMADAFKCWRSEHNRTTNCADYRSSKKRLLPDTRGERKELGLDPSSRPNTFLCDFCPYNSIVMQRQRDDKGYYNFTS